MYLMFPLNIRYQRTGPLAFILVSFSFSPEESSEKKTHKRAEKETAELWCLLPNRKHQSMPSRRHEGWPRRGHKSVLRRTRRHQSLPERRYESLPTLCPYALMPLCPHTPSPPLCFIPTTSQPQSRSRACVCVWKKLIVTHHSPFYYTLPLLCRSGLSLFDVFGISTLTELHHRPMMVSPPQNMTSSPTMAPISPSGNLTRFIPTDPQFAFYGTSLPWIIRDTRPHSHL